MNKLYKPTFFRVLTNSTYTCLAIVFFLLVSVELFLPITENYLYIMAIMIEISLVVVITVFTFVEKKYSFLELNKDGIRQVILSSKKRTIFIPYSLIDKVKVESYAVKIYYGDKKLVLDYYKETKEIKEIIESKMSKK